jgi:hypothetical protein
MGASQIENINILISRTRHLQVEIRRGAAQEEMEAALRQLEKAAEQQGQTGAATVKRFEPDPHRKQTDLSAEEALASILFELQTGNVLVAAAQAVPSGKSGEAGNAAHLDRALQSLESAKNAVADQEKGRSHFEAALAKLVETVDETNAPEEFQKRAKAALDGLVADGSEVVQRVFKALNELDSTNIAEGLKKFGEKSEALATAGRLLRRGIEKIQEGYNALLRLLGPDLLKKIKDRVEKIWENFKSGKYTKDALEFIYDLKDIEDQIVHVLANPKLDAKAVVKGCQDLAPLGAQFKKHMALLSGIVSGITLAAAVLAFTPMRVQGSPFVAGAYLLVVGAVLLIGREFAGAEYSLHWIRGVGRIAGEIAPAAGA